MAKQIVTGEASRQSDPARRQRPRGCGKITSSAPKGTQACGD